MSDLYDFNILVIEDDQKMRNALQMILSKEGYQVEALESAEEALERIRVRTYDLLISDIKLPGLDGMELLTAVRNFNPNTSIIMITAYATVDQAVIAMKAGAEDYISKPFNLEEIKIVVRKVRERQELIKQNRFLHRQLERKYHFENIIASSEKMTDLFRTIQKIKDSKSTILITGETGTGKELIAKAIHFNSNRAEHPFLPVNCGALSDTLLESELFGYVKGAFTGATRDKRGIFETANGGTVFLDEIGDVSPAMQQNLLRVLDSGEIQPVGSTNRTLVNVRIIAATNKDLALMVKQGEFREDLFYRLNVVGLRLPPLRERREDIGLLAVYFLKKYTEENNKPMGGFSPEALRLMEQYPWPGNVRELENIIERAVLLETGDVINPDSLPTDIRNPVVGDLPSHEELLSLEQLVRARIIETLQKTGNNKARAAEILGIDRTTLWRMIRRMEIPETET
ncbi:MAG TPA: sigma-54 dependent transcriptional regulator [bacterium]|nr:sigma-54 dependent transcriptional regulator [bacterium]